VTGRKPCVFIEGFHYFHGFSQENAGVVPQIRSLSSPFICFDYSLFFNLLKNPVVCVITPRSLLNVGMSLPSSLSKKKPNKKPT
jgi:hypothetical protein